MQVRLWLGRRVGVVDGCYARYLWPFGEERPAQTMGPGPAELVLWGSASYLAETSSPSLSKTTLMLALMLAGFRTNSRYG